MLPGSSYHAGNVDLTFPARRACLVKRTKLLLRCRTVWFGMTGGNRAITAPVLV
jgi:hypothetical protein